MVVTRRPKAPPPLPRPSAPARVVDPPAPPPPDPPRRTPPPAPKPVQPEPPVPPPPPDVPPPAPVPAVVADAFPKWLYHPSGDRRIVASQAAQDALGPGWAETPPAAPGDADG